MFNADMVQPLSLIFKNCNQCRVFSNMSKKSNIASVHKEGDKQWTISQFHFFQDIPKFLKELYLIKFFCFWKKKKLVSPALPGFRPNDSCEKQLTSIVHSINAGFDQIPSIAINVNFFDIAKAFDKAWHKGLFKLKLKSFLSDRFQRVGLNGKSSTCSPTWQRFCMD